MPESPKQEVELTLKQNLLNKYRSVEKTKRLVLCVHGIRTFAEWYSDLEAVVQTPEITVLGTRYGYLHIPLFWFPWFFRRIFIERLSRWIQQCQAQYPKAEIVIIAHSFGTYAISKILKNSPLVRCDVLVTCGCIVHEGFNWKELPQDPFVINEHGTLDIWPLLAKSFSWGYGASGVYGFQNGLCQQRKHKCGHSKYLEAAFIRHYWLPIIHNSDLDTKEDGAPVPRDNSPARFTQMLISELPWASIFLVLIGVMALQGDMMFRLQNGFTTVGMLIAWPFHALWTWIF